MAESVAISKAITIGTSLGRYLRMLPAAICLLMLVCFTYAGQSHADKTVPLRLVSINICTDQWLLLLAEPSQIVALSTLSQDERGSYFFREAMQYPQAEPTAEDLLALRPDIVLTGPYTSRYTLSLLSELGIRVESLAIANSFEEMLSNALFVGQLLQRDRQASLVVHKTRERLHKLKITGELQRQTGLDARIAVYDANGYTVGRRTLRGEAIEIAGWHNIASEVNIENYGVIGLEQLLKLAPQAFLASPYSTDTYSRAQALSQHPAIRKSGLNPQIVRVPSNRSLCAGPWTVDVVEQLIKAHPGGKL